MNPQTRWKNSAVLTFHMTISCLQKWSTAATSCRAACEIIFPTAVPDPQYELICIQPIRDVFFFFFFFFCPEPLGLHDMTIHDLRLRNKSTHAREEKRKEYTQDAYNQIYVQKLRPPTAIQILYCALIQRPWPCH